jgi:hypothetical protein
MMRQRRSLIDGGGGGAGSRDAGGVVEREWVSCREALGTSSGGAFMVLCMGLCMGIPLVPCTVHGSHASILICLQ